MEGCRNISERQGAQCAPNIPAPYKVALYPVQAAFEYIASAEQRIWFKNLPTTFELSRETIDRLRECCALKVGSMPRPNWRATRWGLA